MTTVFYSASVPNSALLQAVFTERREFQNIDAVIKKSTEKEN